jgi:drug/metabolite transporter (DMT)-like permease
MRNHQFFRSKNHLKAVLQALLVTVLWSSSMILIKVGFKDGLPPITFAGLRYWFAFLCLAVLVLANPSQRESLSTIPRSHWIQLSMLGLIFYTITQGTHFTGLTFLPAKTMSLIFNFSPIFIAIASGLLKKEAASLQQWIGILLSISGALIYFSPLGGSTGPILGYIIALVGIMAGSTSSILGRQINLHSGLSPLVITTVSMGIGSSLLLLIGGMTQGFGGLGLTQWLIIAWLAIVNTAFAFTLWNTALRTLTAVEASIINNTILPQVAILEWVFLHEPLTARQILAIILILIGAIIVQLKGRGTRAKNHSKIKSV